LSPINLVGGMHIFFNLTEISDLILDLDIQSR
jgi:hypothetical protein